MIVVIDIEGNYAKVLSSYKKRVVTDINVTQLI